MKSLHSIKSGHFKHVHAIAGLYEESGFGTFNTFWGVRAGDTAGSWLKVTFKTAANIEFMGLKTRPCPCERWTSAELVGESATKTVELVADEEYSLYRVNPRPQCCLTSLTTYFSR